MRFFRRINAHVQEYAALYPLEKSHFRWRPDKIMNRFLSPPSPSLIADGNMLKLMEIDLATQKSRWLANGERGDVVWVKSH